MILEMLTVGLSTNCHVVGCEKTGEAVVIDPGFGATESNRIFEKLSRIGLQIKYVVNTHGHIDHTRGNGLVKERTRSPVLIHKEDASMLTDPRTNLAWEFRIASQSPPADRLLQEGDVINVGQLRLKVIHTPGHTKGSISILCEDVVFTGDTLFAGSIGRTDFPGSSFEKIIHSMGTKLMRLPDCVKIHPGHGPSSTIVKERRHNPFVRKFLQS